MGGYTFTFDLWVLIIYFDGVVDGPWYFVLYQTVYLAGGLGGVYAILLAHLAGLILETT